MVFTLYFGNLRVGRVSQTGADFPSLSGTIALDPSITQAQRGPKAEMARFIELSRAALRLMEIEHLQDVTAEVAANVNDLAPFHGYIETDAWRLVDESGKSLPILAPIFADADEITWRWHPRL